MTQDDLGLTGYKVRCYYPHDGLYSNTQKSQIEPGDWMPAQSCPVDYYMVAFSIRVQPPQGDDDDTAVNNIKFICRGPGLNGTSKVTVTGNGLDLGDWGEWGDECDVGTAVCGKKLAMDKYDGGDDETAVNDIKFMCCEH